MPGAKTITESQNLIKTLASGAIWVSLGMFLARLLGYGIRSAIAHFYGVESYGFINTSVSLMIIFAMLALTGLNTGLPRQISFFKAKKDYAEVKKQIFSAFKIASGLSLFLGFVLFFSADFIATHLFKIHALNLYIKIFSIGVPLFVLLEMSTSVFKGLKQMSRFTFYHDILRFALIFTLIIIFGFSHNSLGWISGAYPISYFLINIITFYIIIKQLKLWKWNSLKWNTTDRDILTFSIPLLFSGIFWLLLARTDTILIGAYLNQKFVGLYNAAIPVGQLILTIRQAFSPIILPLLTELLSRGKNKELSLMYYLTAKWTTIIALPIFISMIILPKFYIWVIFGKDFLSAAPILQIVVVGFFLHTIIGPISNLIIIMGRTRLAMLNSFIAFIISISLNVLLIPRLQLIGAAISSVTTYFVYNLLCYIQVYRLIKVQPFRLLHFKFLLAALIPVPILLNAPILKSDGISISLYVIAYLILLILLRSFKAEDFIVIKAVVKRFKQ